MKQGITYLRGVGNYMIPGPEKLSSNIIHLYRFFNDFQKRPLTYLGNYRDTYGDLLQIRVGDKAAFYIVTHPDYMHEALVKQAHKLEKNNDYKNTEHGLARFLGTGLLTSDGDLWKRQRKLVAPALHVQRIRAYADVMTQYTDDMLNDWQDGTRYEIDHEMTRLTLRIVAKTLFNMDAMPVAERVGDAMTTFQTMFDQVDLIPQWVPTPLHIRVNNAVKVMDEIVYNMIRTRRQNNVDEGDLLSMLLAAQDEDGSSMSDEQVRNEAVTLFLAGHETTANTMNWTWYLLSQHPEVESKLHEELDTVLVGKLPTLEDLNSLPYTEMVIKESMRLYPPAWMISRYIAEDMTLGGYTLPKGHELNLPIYFLHRHQDFWDNPEAFEPERFTPEQEAERHRYAYMPFGAGPRICIGNSFAMMEARLLLATIAQRYVLRLEKNQTIEPVPQITMRPSSLKMKAYLRQPVPVLQ